MEISRSFLLMSFVLHVVNGCTWINLTDMCVFMPCLYPSVDSHEVVMVSCCSRCHRYCELQTEERGPKKLAWDTACYQQGFTITGVCCARCKFLRCLEAEIQSDILNVSQSSVHDRVLPVFVAEFQVCSCHLSCDYLGHP